MNVLRVLCSTGIFAAIIRRRFHPRNPRKANVAGINFSNIVGLGAGFDKNARYLRELESLGFGFVEIGTVTPLPQDGNPKPRLFRLKGDRALINRMGFNNDGVVEIVERLKKWRAKNNKSKLVIGGNIGKNKSTPNEDAVSDYEICFRALHSYVDYFVVNVSSPNTPGLRELQEKESLRKILSSLQKLNFEFPSQKPIFLKIAPDLSWAQVDDVISLAKEIRLDGLVASNTTISRDNLATSPKKIESIGNGGLSGAPLKSRSTELVKYICERAGNDFSVIASGGIENGDDAREKINAGAKLVQVWTGFIYEGPAIIKDICKSS